MKTLTAVLFAGGESRRMGMDKATLLIDGKPLWTRQLDLLRGLAPEKILVSARTRPPWCPPEIETVLDRSPSRGPLSGLAAVLGQIRTTHLLALAIDMPQMTAAHLAKLWSLTSPGVGVIPRTGNLSEPLCGIYPCETAAVAERTLTEGDASMQNVLRVLADTRNIRFYPLTKNESPMYKNFNTQEQWKRQKYCR